MSVESMSLVWKATDLKPTHKFVLMAYADHAHDDGTNVFPAYATIAKKTCLSRRQVIRVTKELIEAGYLIDCGKSHFETNLLAINHELLGGDNLSKNVRQMSPKPSLTTATDINTKERVVAVVNGVTKILSDAGVGEPTLSRLADLSEEYVQAHVNHWKKENKPVAILIHRLQVNDPPPRDPNSLDKYTSGEFSKFIRR